ncbi:MAG TPA: ABC transporter permease subunit [Candidatus Hydrogenedentes bacterium]|nr:ABC transporter permease subunit [Candidatus Hydrogenedentota bacterium]
MTKKGRIKRKLRGVVLHIALVAGSLLFAAPFLWLIGTSAKTADELFPPRWKVPGPDKVLQSPYIALRENERAERPYKVAPEDWERLAPVIKKAITAQLRSIQMQFPAFYIIHLGHPDLAEGIFVRLLRRAPDGLFSKPETECAEWFAENITNDLVKEVFDQAYRRLAMGDISFFGTDMSMEQSPPPINIEWKVISGQVTIVPRDKGFKRAGQELHYNFFTKDRFAVQTVLPLTMPFSNLKRFRLSNHADRSWYTLWAAIEAGGKRFQAIEPAYLSNNRWQESTWQFASEDDRGVMMKTWLILKEAGASDFNEPGKVRITIECRRTPYWKTTLGKAWFNYREVMRMVPVWRYIKNSFWLVGLNILGQILGASMVAFAFARLRWPGREFCFVILLATLMIPPQVTLVPVFLIFKQLGWYNTLKPLWVPAFFGSAFFIFLLRQFMRSIPTDLEDSAKIDGCSYWGIYYRIILPLIKPALATIAIFTFMNVWNDFMGPLVFITKQELYPLSLGLFSLHAMFILMARHELMMAASVLMTVPVIVLFFAAQRQFIQGITLTGLKG